MAEVTVVQYNAGFVVLSYIVSLVGCVTALELLHRRTSRRGLYNWYLLVSACIAMGGVGIWCMHFIGNRAIVLQHNDPDRQIVYSTGFTAVSFFLPIVVLMGAFYLLGITEKITRYYLATSALLCGSAICGMHYVGQLGIANYDCSYPVANVVGAAVIAVLASLIALSIFFRLRERWTDSWWKRSLCGAMLALAVSGMHWTATVGPIYHFKGASATKGGHSRVQTVAVATALSVVACWVLLGVTLVRTRKRAVYKTRAHELALATAYFDADGRVMVTSEGGLPNVKITNHYVERAFGDDELSRTHPTFVWVYKASRTWSAIKDLIPGMQEALSINPTARQYRPSLASSSDRYNDDFAVVFKQLFCVAANNLAGLIHEPLENLGVLFEEPITTGATRSRRPSLQIKEIRKLSCASSQCDVESQPVNNGLGHLGRGQYLSVTKQLAKEEVEKFMAMGYRFAAISQVAEPMAKSMQVPKEWMLRSLERMQLSSSPAHLLPFSTYVACFMVRPSIQKNFDVLVPRKTQNQLPVSKLQSGPLTRPQKEFLGRFDEMTLEKVLKALVGESGTLMQPEEQEFRWHLYQTIEALVEDIGDAATMMQATMSAKPVRAPCRGEMHGVASGWCDLVTVRFMASIHQPAPRDGLCFVPLLFFSLQQVLDAEHKDWEDRFKRAARAEFRHCIGVDVATSTLCLPGRSRSRRSSSVTAAEPGDLDNRKSIETSSVQVTPTNMALDEREECGDERRESHISDGSKTFMLRADQAGSIAGAEKQERRTSITFSNIASVLKIDRPDVSLSANGGLDSSSLKAVRSVETREDVIGHRTGISAETAHGSFVYELFKLFNL